MNGIPLDGSSSLAKLLTGTVDRRVQVEVASSPEGNDSRTVRIKPITQIERRGLLHQEWVDTRRAKVDSMSHGRLGYIHLSAMGMGNLEEFKDDLMTETYDKEGAVIDVRGQLFRAPGVLPGGLAPEMPVLTEKAVERAGVKKHGEVPVADLGAVVKRKFGVPHSRPTRTDPAGHTVRGQGIVVPRELASASRDFLPAGRIPEQATVTEAVHAGHFAALDI